MGRQAQREPELPEGTLQEAGVLGYRKRIHQWVPGT